MKITSVWQIYRDPTGNLHTGAVQKCIISVAAANLLSGTGLSLVCFLFSKKVYMTRLHPGISKIDSVSTSGRDKYCVELLVP